MRIRVFLVLNKKKCYLSIYFPANELGLIGIFLIQVLVLGKITCNKAQSSAKLIRCFSGKCLYYIKYMEKFVSPKILDHKHSNLKGP